ncbi:hypothetical protein PINS_up012484 [Pythium insidiosum]|nr:hypothetical protein PINS_up012484 [Pythium insidiosum]
MKVDWRNVHGLPDEQVTSNVFFEKLLIGEFETCVTLRHVANDTRKSKSKETCYKTMEMRGQRNTKIRDLVTGEKLVLAPACSADRDWVAMVLGIPRRVNIVELWERQCSGLRWLTNLTTVFAWLGEIWLAASLLDYAANEIEGPLCGEGSTFVVTTLALASQAAPVLVWRYSMDAPGYEDGLCLKLATTALVIFASAWVFWISLLVTRTCRREEPVEWTENAITQRCIEDDRLQEV